MLRPGIIAHRGFDLGYPENTMDAFRAALAGEGPRGVMGIELDVRLCRDNQVVVFHDRNLMRLARRITSIRRIDYENLRFALRRNPRFINLEIPLLAQLLDLVRHRLRLYIEVKADGLDLNRFGLSLAALLEKYQPRGDVVIHSFSVRALERLMRILAPFQVQYGFLFRSLRHWRHLPRKVRDRLDYLHPRHNLLWEQGRALQEAGMPINTWTVNDLPTLRRVTASPAWPLVEGLMTGNPDLGSAAVREGLIADG